METDISQRTMNAEELKKEVHQVSRKLDTVLDILKSNPEFKKEGLVEQVNRIDEHLNKLTARFDMLWFKLTWVAAGGGALIQVFWLLLSKLFKP